MSHDHGDHPSLRMKPPSHEDVFFQKQDRERIDKLREERRRREEHEGRARLKELHWMCCPKCGSPLSEEEHQGVLIDRCASCNGIFLDDGELEALILKNEQAVLGILRFVCGRRKK